MQAYRRAAQTLRQLDQPVSEIVREEDEAGLHKLPGIGESLARAIVEMLLTGRLPILDRLRGEHDPIALLASVPGIGKELAARLHTSTRGPLKGRRIVRGREGEGRRVTPEPRVSFQSEA